MPMACGRAPGRKESLEAGNQDSVMAGSGIHPHCISGENRIVYSLPGQQKSNEIKSKITSVNIESN